jgi:serine/threonine-protein kinase
MLVARFQREAEIASRLSHPNVVQAISAGQLPSASEGAAGAGAMYIVMEYLDGISLRSAFAAAGGALPLARALRIVLQLCEAVGEAHSAGVVHRDLKPENVMLMKRDPEVDVVKVLDFGIARLPGGNTPAVTQAGAVFGTARYVSPEGAIGSPVGPPADVYALATIFYQALAGRTPFDGDTAIDVLGKQINDAPPPLRSIDRAANVPEPLASAIMRNLAKRAEDRNPDARAFGLSILSAARASGLAPETLVARSAALDGAASIGAPLASATTEPQTFGPSLAAKIAAADGFVGGRSSPAAGGQSGRALPPDARPVARPEMPRDDLDRASLPSGAISSRGLLAIVLGCLAGGAALAAIAGYHLQGPTRSADVPPRPSPPVTIETMADAGRYPDGSPL